MVQLVLTGFRSGPGHAPAPTLLLIYRADPLPVVAGPPPSLMDDHHIVSNELSSPTGQGFSMLSFPTVEEDRGHMSTSSLAVASPIQLLTAPPLARTLEGFTLTPSPTFENALTISVDSSSSPLPFALPAPPPTPVQQSSSISRGAAGGITVLAIFALLALASGLVWWYRHRRAKIVEVDPENALFAACEDLPNPTLRLSTAGSVKGVPEFHLYRRTF